MNEPDERTGPGPRAVSKTQYGFDEEEPPGKPRRHPIWRDVSAQQWNDWRWQSQNAIHSDRQLRNLPTFSTDDFESLGELEGTYKLAIPPYDFSLIKPDDAHDSIRLQSMTLPLESEAPSRYELDDPLEEEANSPIPGLTHRYPDRVLLVTPYVCRPHSRFYTRKRATTVRDGPDAVSRNVEWMRVVPESARPSLTPRKEPGGIFSMFVTNRLDHPCPYIVDPSMASARLEVRERIRDGHKSLYARKAFAPGDVLERISARKTLSEPAVHSVQLNETEHILLEPPILEYTNHSCSPNVVFDLEEMVVMAIEPIRPGDEIVYFYPSTELSMAQPFTCDCGSSNCLGVIRGADYLPAEVLDRYHLAAHIRNLLT